MPTRTSADLDWTAWRYVLGELPGGELDAFERQLDADQVAREAVARAFEGVEAVARVAAERPTPLALPGRRGRFVLPLAAAASILVGSAAWLAGPGIAPVATGPTSTPDPAEGEAARLAAAWTDLRADGVEPTAVDVEPEADDAAGADRPLPSWMVAGTSNPADEPNRLED